MNVCHFMGRVANDLQLKEIVKSDGNKTDVLNFVLAVTRNFKTSNGEKGKQVNYLNMEVWDSAARLICDNFQKGDPILVHCSARSYPVEVEGKKFKKICFRVEQFEFLPRNYNKDQEENND